MNKAEAAKYLEIGVRSLERHTSAGRVKTQRVRTKTGPSLDYEEAELARFKAVLEAEPQSPAASPGPPEASPEGMATLARVEPQVLAATRGQGKAEPQVLVPLDLLASLAARLGEAEKSPRVPTADKLLLDLAECSALTGISKAALRVAVASGELAGRKIGRAIRVRREELERFVRETC